MKIVVLDGYTLGSENHMWNNLSKYGKLKVYERTPNIEEEIIQRIKDAQVIFVNSTPITGSIISKCSGLHLISTLSTGYTGIDVAAAHRYGITVCNVPAYSTQSVAQFTFALILEAFCRVGDYSKAVLTGEWSSCTDFTYPKYPIFELYSKTIGIIGYGNIGSQVASLALAFGMNVLVYSRSRSPLHKLNECIEFTDFNNLLARSDIISLHTHLNDSTRHIICSETISKMKDGAAVINTSRGQLIDEHSLAEALNTGKLAFAAVDVVSSEPISKANPLLKAKNIIITPHVAWSSYEAKQRLLKIAINNLESFISGVPINVVN